jgi:hypothetical protein
LGPRDPVGERWDARALVQLESASAAPELVTALTLETFEYWVGRDSESVPVIAIGCTNRGGADIFDCRIDVVRWAVWDDQSSAWAPDTSDQTRLRWSDDGSDHRATLPAGGRKTLDLARFDDPDGEIVRVGNNGSVPPPLSHARHGGRCRVWCRIEARDYDGFDVEAEFTGSLRRTGAGVTYRFLEWSTPLRVVRGDCTSQADSMRPPPS